MDSWTNGFYWKYVRQSLLERIKADRREPSDGHRHFFVKIIPISMWGAASINGGTPSSLDGLFHGKSIVKWMMTGGNPVSSY